MIDPLADPVLLDGRYELGPLLGVGASARVHRAYDRLLDRPVAIKLFRRDVYAMDLVRVVAEVRCLMALHHPNVVTLHDSVAGEDLLLSYLVLELVDGPTLAAFCADGPVNPARVSQIGHELGSALAHVHAHGMVHHDVKPANVVLGSDGHVRLLDFGVVHQLSPGSTPAPLSEFTIGTAPYLAPEQVRRHEVGAPADVYALGLVLLECLTGHREYHGAPVACALARLDHPPVIPAALPAPWPVLLGAMTAPEPASRPTAAAVEQWLAPAA